MERFAAVVGIFMLVGTAGCKIEALQQLDPVPEGPPPIPEPDYKLADSVPLRSISGELIGELKENYKMLESISRGDKLGKEDISRPQYLTRQFRAADLLPEGDEETFRQIIPLRHVKTEQWSLHFTVAATKRKNTTPVDPLNASDGSANWALRAFRNYDDSPESHDLIELSFANPQAMRKIPSSVRGKVVVLDLRGWKVKQLADLLAPDSQALLPLHESGAIAAVVLSSLQPGELSWNAIQSQWRGDLVDLLAPGEALPPRLDWLALANATASGNYQVWRKFVRGSLGSKRKTRRRSSKRSRRMLVSSQIKSLSRWSQESSIIGKIPGEVAPQQAVIIVTHRDEQPVNNTLALNPPPDSTNALVFQLAMMQMASRWMERGTRIDTSLYFASFGASTKQYAGLRQFLRQQSLRPENIRAVIEIGALSFEPNAVAMSMQSLLAPTWLREAVESAAPQRFRFESYTPASLFDPLLLLEKQSTPALIIENSPTDSEQSASGTSENKAIAWNHVERLVDSVLQVAWTVAEAPEQDLAGEGDLGSDPEAEPKTPPAP